jgi:hypothetical protein
MKKIFLVVCSLVTLVSLFLTGCGSEDSAVTETPAAETPTEVEVTAETPVETTSTVTEETTDETASVDETAADESASTEETTEETAETETVAEETAQTTSAYEGGSQAGCEDTDGGKNYDTYGTIVDAHGTTDYDRCSENENYLGRLYESYCGEDGKRARETYDCPSGSCKAGACAPAEETAE